jgi:hypothetical protein
MPTTRGLIVRLDGEAFAKTLSRLSVYGDRAATLRSELRLN